MPLDYRFVLAGLVFGVLWYYFDYRWCWTCKRFTAKTTWWPIHVVRVDKPFGSNPTCFVVLKERRKDCACCDTSVVINAKASLVDEQAASIYRDDINHLAAIAKQ